MWIYGVTRSAWKGPVINHTCGRHISSLAALMYKLPASLLPFGKLNIAQMHSMFARHSAQGSSYATVWASCGSDEIKGLVICQPILENCLELKWTSDAINNPIHLLTKDCAWPFLFNLELSNTNVNAGTDLGPSPWVQTRRKGGGGGGSRQVGGASQGIHKKRRHISLQTKTHA